MKARATADFSKRVSELRKQHGWSQVELAKKIGTSAAIIGRYERGGMTPSIEVARRIAEAFDVTIDFLVNETGTPDVLKDRDMIARWEALSDLPAEDRERIIFVVDGLIRDARTRQAYGVRGAA